MFNTWDDNLGAMQPTYPGDPGRGVDLGGRLINPRTKEILPAPPANCDAAYRAKYIRTFGVDPGCLPYVAPPPTPYVPPITGTGTNNPGPTATPIIPIVETPYIAPSQPTAPGIPITPVHKIRHPHTRPMPVQPAAKARRVRPGKTSGELCPSFGHYNMPIPGVDEYQVVACTPGQPLPKVNRGLQKVVRREALARHPGGGQERTGQAGDYRGSRSSGGYSSGATRAAGSAAVDSSSTGQICLSPMVLLGAAAVLFFMMKR